MTLQEKLREKARKEGRRALKNSWEKAIWDVAKESGEKLGSQRERARLISCVYRELGPERAKRTGA